MDRVAIQIDLDPIRVTVHPEAMVEDLGPALDGVHDYEVRWPWGHPQPGRIIWCSREPQDVCAAVRAELARMAS